MLHSLLWQAQGQWQPGWRVVWSMVWASSEGIPDSQRRFLVCWTFQRGISCRNSSVAHFQGLFCAKALGRCSHLYSSGFCKTQISALWFTLRQDGNAGLRGGGGAWRAQKITEGFADLVLGSQPIPVQLRKSAALLICFWAPSPAH